MSHANKMNHENKMSHNDKMSHNNKSGAPERDESSVGTGRTGRGRRSPLFLTEPAAE